MTRSFFIFALCCFLLACQDEAVLHAPELSTPTVTGLRFMDRSGSIILDWGTPNNNIKSISAKCGQIYLSVFPNPAVGIFSIRHTAYDCDAVTDIWVTSARLSTDQTPEQLNFANANLARPGGFLIKTLAKHESLQKGIITWDSTDDRGNKVPSGFYRIYVRIDGKLLWQDILLARKSEDIPIFIKKMLKLNQ